MHSVLSRLAWSNIDGTGSDAFHYFSKATHAWVTYQLIWSPKKLKFLEDLR